MASVSGCASRQWMMAGLPTRRARSSWRRNTWAWTSRGERSRKKSRPISPIPTTRSPAGEPLQLGEVLLGGLGGVVRMDADRSPDIGVARGHRHGGAIGLAIRPDGDHAAKPDLAGARENRVEIVGEVGEVQVRVRIEERHGGIIADRPRARARGCPRPAPGPSARGDAIRAGARRRQSARRRDRRAPPPRGRGSARDARPPRRAFRTLGPRVRRRRAAPGTASGAGPAFATRQFGPAPTRRRHRRAPAANAMASVSRYARSAGSMSDAGNGQKSVQSRAS